MSMSKAKMTKEQKKNHDYIHEVFVNIHNVTACEYHIFHKSISFMFEFWSIFPLFENSVPVFAKFWRYFVRFRLFENLLL